MSQIVRSTPNRRPTRLQAGDGRPRPADQGLGKVRACLVGDGRMSEGVRDARRVGQEETGP
jgi:hypothetical protein